MFYLFFYHKQQHSKITIDNNYISSDRGGVNRQDQPNPGVERVLQKERFLDV